MMDRCVFDHPQLWLHHSGVQDHLRLNLNFPLPQSVCVEQLTLDFEFLINEVIRNDAAWASQFCSFSDYDVVILEVGNHHLSG